MPTKELMVIFIQYHLIIVSQFDGKNVIRCYKINNRARLVRAVHRLLAQLVTALHRNHRGAGLIPARGP